MKSIKTRLMVAFLSVVVTLVILLGAISLNFTYRSTMHALNLSMQETASISAKVILKEMDTYLKATQSIGTRLRLSDDTVDVDTKKDIINYIKGEYGFLYGNIVDMNGKSMIGEAHTANEKYFKEAFNGKTIVSNIVTSEELEIPHIITAAPLWENGKYGSKVVGAVYFVLDAKFLSETTNEVVIGDTGYAYIIDQSGTIIAHKNPTYVANKTNVFETTTGKDKDERLIGVAEHMVGQERGYGKYSIDNEDKILAYAPIGINGWSLAIATSKSEFIQELYRSVLISSFLMAVFLLLSIVITIVFANGISKPIKEMMYASRKLAKGEIDIELSTTSKSEIGELSQAFSEAIEGIKNQAYVLERISVSDFSVHVNQRSENDVVAKNMNAMIRTQKKYVENISKVMEKLTMGDTEVRIDIDYLGDFAPIKSAINRMIEIQAFNMREAIRILSLEKNNRELTILTELDGLTGIYNRRALDRQLSFLVGKAFAEKATIGFFMIDIDHFKKYNDVYGHFEGDRCIKAVVKSITQGIRKEDFFARYGGEEFAIIVYNPKESTMERIGKTILDVIWNTEMVHIGNQHQRVTVSIGYTVYSPTGDDDEREIIKLADSALYLSKENGRNRIMQAKHIG